MSFMNALRIFSVTTVKLPVLRYCSSNVRNLKEEWDLVSAVCLERRPVITTTPNELENRFNMYLQKVEFEKSYKSDWEVRKEREKKQLERLKKGEISGEELDSLPKLTAQDLEDMYQEEIKQYMLAPRITEADEKNDLKSLDRALDKYLILLVKQKLGRNFSWCLPQGVREQGETMRQAAERVLVEKCGENLKALFLGNAPCGFYKYKYPKAVRENSKSIGAKVFFFKAWHLEGQVNCNKNVVEDYKWSIGEELHQELNKEYYKSVSQILICT